MARALVGSLLGSACGFLLLVAGPQEVQQWAIFAGSTWPAAFVVAGVLAYFAGFLGNSTRPQGWTALVAWAAGWLAGVLIVVVGVYVFGSQGD